MSIKLYKLDPSPPARATMMGCEIFNVPVQMIDVNLLEKEHLTPDYIKKNPTHSVPMLEIDDLVIHDSHAILTYLADKYGKDDSWYPKDLKKRALVNQKLFFDTAILFPRLRSITYPVVIEGKRTVEQQKLDDIAEAYDFIEKFLSQSKYLAGDQVTIADVSAYSTCSSLVDLVAVDKNKYPKLSAWMQIMSEQSYSKKCNENGAAILRSIIKERLGS